jgi:hypothetical protein
MLLETAAVVGVAVGALLAAPQSADVSYIPFHNAKPILEAMAEGIPAELRAVDPGKLETVWNDWVKRRDSDIRSRLTQGDADSVVNFLLFGTSFTSVPRLTSQQLNALGNKSETDPKSSAKVQELLGARIHDLIQALKAPGENERLLFTGRILKGGGVDVSSADGAARATDFLLSNVKRVLAEHSSFQQAIAAAQSLNDATEEFAERSTLYKERGLSLDTSLPPDYALEVALAEMKKRGLLAPGSVTRVGIIGPGLDFTDKQEGYDFYPTQTVQPFAVMDSLLRLGLAKREGMEVDTLDLSPRVNEHVMRAQHAALKGRGYALQLPRDPARRWKPGLVDYWRRFGDQIGEPVAPVKVPPSLKGIVLRAVRVRPELVKGLRALDVNIVLQREEAEARPKFDLLIATNVLVYYDTFEQELALSNARAMLKPGGFLLTNNLLLELPVVKMRAGDYISVQYSPQQTDGDQVLWYTSE